MLASAVTFWEVASSLIFFTYRYSAVLQKYDNNTKDRAIKDSGDEKMQVKFYANISGFIILT